GAQERHVPVSGWERPGVIGLAAATVLLKAQRVLPGHNVVVAGTGPLLLVVAAAILKGGGRVAAVIDANPRSAWLADWRRLATRPDLLARGAGWLSTLVAHGVMPVAAHAIRTIEGYPAVTGVTIAHVDRRHGKPRAIACDAVCLGYGLTPATDMTRLLGVEHTFDDAAGGWHAIVDVNQCTSRPRLYVCGDAAGVAGAAAAPPQGRLAALAAARDLGRIDAAVHTASAAPLQREAARAARFGAAMNGMSTPPPSIVQAMTPETMVCLCEHLTRRQLDVAVTAGATTLNDLKSATRCGMGPCGGRLCEDAAARLVALQTGATRTMIGQATGRPPLRPVELDALVGNFDYDALPMAQPAPL
ncbi:MAG: NAD(P)/FAD-dependent oxidoreductase, partial [Betaproteobacteria bacterium]